MFYHSNQQYIKMLKNLSAILDKLVVFSEEKKISPEVLLNSRLAPDQFPFIKQVQVCCDSPKLGMARFTGKEAPKNEDTEKTVEELKVRINNTVDFLSSLTEEDFKNASDKKIEFPFMKGKYITPEECLVEFTNPNFYFHVTTAYSILRHNGMNIGKMDFMGSLPFKDLEA